MWDFVYQAQFTVPANGAYVQFYAELHCCGDSDRSSTTGYFDSTFFDGAAVLSQTFSYDPYGNLSKSGTFPFQPTYNAATNRYASIPGVTVSYDNDGNVLWDGQHAYTWDVYGKSIAVDSVNLTYDALGRMVEQNRSGAYTQIVYSPTGAKLALMNGQTLTKGLVGLPGGGQAVYNSSGLLYYGHADHLGSIKMASTAGRAFSWSLAFAPFGEIYSNSGPIDPDFTGMRSDIGGGIYDFPAREYTYLGRWPSPDPSGLASVHLRDPQTLNRYAYVRNNPLTLVDPNGLDECGGNGNIDDACPDPIGVVGGPAGPGGAGGGVGPDPSPTPDPTPTPDPNPTPDPTSGGDPTNGGSNCSGSNASCGGNSSGSGLDPNQFGNATLDMFDVATILLVPSQADPNVNGFFLGLNLNPESATFGQTFTVTNDVNSYNLSQIQALAPPYAFTTMGFTPVSNPYVNYGPSDATSFGMLGVQTWELGNSLALITGTPASSINDNPLSPGFNEPGYYFCPVAIGAPNCPH